MVEMVFVQTTQKNHFFPNVCACCQQFFGDGSFLLVRLFRPQGANDRSSPMGGPQKLYDRDAQQDVVEDRVGVCWSTAETIKWTLKWHKVALRYWILILTQLVL